MQTEEKIAAVVILYYPPKEVLSNVLSYYDFVEKIYVYDNTDKESCLKAELTALPKVEFYHDYRNEGIPKRINSAAELSIKENFHWLLTMDQDTCFPGGSMITYLKCFDSFPNKKEVIMFGTQYDSSENASLLPCMPEEAEDLITSGMLLNLNLFTKVGGFDENLFIDSVDHDYCIRAKLSKHPIIKFRNIHILHHLGEQVLQSSIKTLYLIKKRKLIHSPLRCYYMYRNLLYLENKFKHAPQYTVKLRKVVMGNLKACFFYGRQPLKLFRYLLLARKDYQNKCMGKLNADRML